MIEFSHKITAAIARGYHIVLSPHCYACTQEVFITNIRTRAGLVVCNWRYPYPEGGLRIGVVLPDRSGFIFENPEWRFCSRAPRVISGVGSTTTGSPELGGPFVGSDPTYPNITYCLMQDDGEAVINASRSQRPWYLKFYQSCPSSPAQASVKHIQICA